MRMKIWRLCWLTIWHKTDSYRVSFLCRSGISLVLLPPADLASCNVPTSA
jgi:hypothetical protein